MTESAGPRGARGRLQRLPPEASAPTGSDQLAAPRDERDRRRGLYGISVAAELSGLHPQTLRLYERRGLLNPGRSTGGTRRYSDADLERLRAIAELAGAGLNLAGIKLALGLQEEASRLRAELAELRGHAPGEAVRRPPPGVTAFVAAPSHRRRRGSARRSPESS